MAQLRTKTIALLLTMMSVPILLSYFFFMSQSLRLDESQSLWQTSRNVLDIFSIVAGDVHVPLFHILLHFWILLFGETVQIARGMSLFFFLLSIPALYVLGKYAYDRTVGLFAALLFSISPFMNWYGNEIRMYTLFTFCVILNHFFFLHIFKANLSKVTPQNRKIKDSMWVGYTLTAVVGVFSHYFFFLILASQLVFYFLRRDLFSSGTLQRLGVAAAVVLGTIAPWGWYVLHKGQAAFQEPTLGTPTTVNLFSSVAQFMFGFQSDKINTFFLSLWPVSVIFGLFALRRGQKMQPETEYFLVAVVVPFFLAFFGSFILAPIFVSRYLIFTVPPLYLLISKVCSNYSPRMATTLRYVLVGVMICTLLIEIANSQAPVKENYKDAAQYLTTHATVQDVIVLSAPFTIYPIQYYYRGAVPVKTLPEWNQYAYGPIPSFNESTLPAQATEVADKSQNLYLLLSYDQGYENKIRVYFDTHYQRTDQKNFSNGLNLYVYRLRYDTGLSAISSNK